MTFFAESELILNKDGSIYHLNLLPEQIADTIITVGDPDRVAKVSQYFDTIDTRVQKREFVTHTGTYNGKRLTVISTGIGTDNIDIVFNELDALANIDLARRTEKSDFRQLTFVRIGTSGSLQKDIPIDSILVSEFGLGMDGLLHFYEQETNAETNDILAALAQNTFPLPLYLAKANDNLLAALPGHFLKGITATCPGFYAPQGRALRGSVKNKRILDILGHFKHQDYRITNFEMETAGIYGLAKILGHRAISFNAILANRIDNTFSKAPEKITEKLIKNVLDWVDKL